MKLLITTRADESCIEWAKLTHPIFHKYAEKVNADFIVLDEVFDCKEASGGIGNGTYQYRIMKHYDLHGVYDRILHLDNDMLLSPTCPNLFEVVPYEAIGSILEDKGSRRQQRLNCIKNSQTQFGDIGWVSEYINTGVFVSSKCHKEIYRSINGKYFVDWGTDDIHIGYLIKKYGYQIHELPFQFNHMTMFSEPWNNNPDRFESHIIHYAGRGVFDSEVTSKLEQAHMDYKRLYT